MKKSDIAKLRVHVDVQDLNTFFGMLFKGVNIGSGFKLETEQEVIEGVFHDKADLIMSDDTISVVSYDFCTDELDDEHTDKFHQAFDHAIQVLNIAYTQPVEGQDGSGGGLVYGALALKARK
jgi:hypothetical protein